MAISASIGPTTIASKFRFWQKACGSRSVLQKSGFDSKLFQPRNGVRISDVIPHTPRHPAAQKLAQHNHQSQQRPQRPTPQSTRQQSQHRPATQFHDFGNVGQAVAIQPISKQTPSIRRAVVESQVPQMDLFTVPKQPRRDEAATPSVSVLKTQPENQFGETEATDQTALNSPLPQQTKHSETAAKVSDPESSPARIDRRVRKANWAEIEAKPSIDRTTKFQPLQQETLPPRRVNPQVESAAREQIQYGQSLARRRAYFAAREEFIRALLLIASSYNTEANSTAHPERLAQGLVAIDELGDLTRANGSALQQKILSHQSQLIAPQDLATTSPMQAAAVYSNFAQSQIMQAIGSSAAGSEALHALGKLEAMVPKADRNQIKTLVFYRAAVQINPSNAVCANDLGVLLFNMGRLEESEKTLIAALKLTQSQLGWNNLAFVHRQRAANASSNEERTHQLALANLAAQQAEKFAVHSRNSQSSSDGLNNSQWATPNEFQNNAAFPNTVIQHAETRSVENAPKPGASKPATFKQKMKDWF